MIRHLLKALFLCLPFLLLPQAVRAQTEFTTDYQVSYVVNSAGSTHTKFDITLTNKLSNIYASQFSLSIGSTKLSNIKTYQESGTLEPELP